ncbi:hypothetical protein E2C01_049507 [Portunus trituberculatus]|uniref:Uncharacterized protein n=1 Tax=Portunus trituberculatus TaxID=210409 RepID=A0A5B7GG81_PORTR|nr:hypothetical protein [Portunus trituberculatus]
MVHYGRYKGRRVHEADVSVHVSTAVLSKARRMAMHAAALLIFTPQTLKNDRCPARRPFGAPRGAQFDPTLCPGH